MQKNSYYLTPAIAGLLLLILFPALCPASEGKKFPKAVVEKRHVDAGTVVEGKNIRHTFLLQNRGEAPLLISRAETDCTCTKITHDEVILPDRNCYLRVVFHTHGQAGEQIKTIRIHSNDPEQPELELSLQARVLPAISVEPDRVFFNGVPGKALNQAVEITAPEGNPLELFLKQNRLSDQTGVAMEKNIGKNSYTIHFRHKGETPETFRGRVQFSTNVAHVPVITIPVYTRLLPRFSVFPSQIDFGSHKLRNYTNSKLPDPVKSINLKSMDGIPPKIETIELNERIFIPQIRYLPSLGVTRIELKALMRKLYENQIHETIRIGLINKEQLEIPVHIDIK